MEAFLLGKAPPTQHMMPGLSRLRVSAFYILNQLY